MARSIRWYQSDYIQMTPLLLLFVIPAFAAFLGSKYAKLRSAINFQQGTISSSPWRCGLTMALISLPPFAMWCLICGGASPIFYLLGSFLALILVSTTSANILHYIPSPSIFMYLKLRFQSESLQRICGVLQAIILLTILFILLMLSSSLLNAISRFPIYLLVPLIASLCLLSVVFTGQSFLMLPVFYAVIATLSAGSGVFVYFALEEVTSFTDIISMRFTLSKCLTSFFVGFIAGFYQIAAGTMLYQVYFSLSTRHKLRLCFTFYGVFQMFFSAFTFIIVSLFTHFLETHCKLHYTTASLFQFIKFTVPTYPILSYSVATSLILLLLFVYKCVLTSLVSLLWEEFIKNKFKEWTSIRQLCALQAMTIKVTIGLILGGLAIGLSPFSYDTYLPLLMHILIALATLLCTTFACGYYLPCTNYKGCLAGLLVCGLMGVSIIAVTVIKQPLPRLENNCTITRSLESLISKHQLEDQTKISLRIPSHIAPFTFAYLPLLLVTTFFCVSLAVSALSGWQDLFVLDWNLIVWPCCMNSSLSAKAYRKRRAFVESDSFRYAQNNDTQIVGPVPEVIIEEAGALGLIT